MDKKKRPHDDPELLALQAEHALIVARCYCAAARDRAMSMTTDDAALAEALRVRAARRSDDAAWLARRAVVA